MDLHVDVLSRSQNAQVIALSHYYKENGDMIPDPDMELLVNHREATVSPQSYQDRLGYQRVTGDNSSSSLNQFLSEWLDNLVAQGHTLVKH